MAGIYLKPLYANAMAAPEDSVRLASVLPVYWQFWRQTGLNASVNATTNRTRTRRWPNTARMCNGRAGVSVTIPMSCRVRPSLNLARLATRTPFFCRSTLGATGVAAALGCRRDLDAGNAQSLRHSVLQNAAALWRGGTTGAFRNFDQHPRTQLVKDGLAILAMTLMWHTMRLCKAKVSQLHQARDEPSASVGKCVYCCGRRQRCRYKP